MVSPQCVARKETHALQHSRSSTFLSNKPQPSSAFCTLLLTRRRASNGPSSCLRWAWHHASRTSSAEGKAASTAAGAGTGTAALPGPGTLSPSSVRAAGGLKGSAPNTCRGESLEIPASDRYCVDASTRLRRFGDSLRQETTPLLIREGERGTESVVCAEFEQSYYK